MTRSLASRIVAIIILCVIAYLASVFIPSPFGWIVSLLCGVGVLIIVVYMIFDLIH